MIITIDGPTASGKTTIARILARKLNFYYLSSGLLFRGLAYTLVHEYRYQEEQLQNPRQEDIEKILQEKRLTYKYAPGTNEQLFLDGANITALLRDKKISQYSSMIATNIIVRTALAEFQHEIADDHNLVAEGRDMGSIIFPQASVKFYLTASLAARAERWRKDQDAKGRTLSFEQAQEEVKNRDERDANRIVAPLCIPENAIIIDDSVLSKEEVLALMEKEIQKTSFLHL